MKYHKIERNIPFDQLDIVISRYENEGYEVAGITYREYHYDIVFKKSNKSYTMPNGIFDKYPDIVQIHTPYPFNKPYYNTTTTSISGKSDDLPYNENNKPVIVTYCVN